MEGMKGVECDQCGYTEFEDGDDGFFYCGQCSSQAQGFRDTGIGDEADVYAGVYAQSAPRCPVKKEEPTESQTTRSEFFRRLEEPYEQPNDKKPNGKQIKREIDDDYEPSSVRLTGKLVTPEDYAFWVRSRYVLGIQLMIQSQCEVLVEEFGVSPLICGLVGVLCTRLVAETRVFEETWASQKVDESEMQMEEGNKVRVPRAQDRDEPHDLSGKRLVIIWLKSLKQTIPLSFSLSICFLACHIAREPILPTDIVKWCLEGKLPYLNAFVKIGEVFGEAPEDCPETPELMFRPFEVIGPEELESQAASIAQRIGLELPPVNFHALARRYLEQLQLPLEKILPHASRIYDWLMPPDLWLSSKVNIPSGVCVMSIIIVAIRILYNINGYGKWEEMYCNTAKKPEKKEKRKRKETQTEKKPVKGSSYFQNHKSIDTAELLGSLEATYEKILEAQADSVNLSSYLKLCKDVVFGTPSNNTEKIMIENLWEFYEKQEEVLQPEKASSNKGQTSNSAAGETIPTQDDVSLGSAKDRSLNRLKSNMEEKGFIYVPPRDRINNVDYLHYQTKNSEGRRLFVAHADYYILLRACALVAAVDVQVMHKAVLKFEKRLVWLEKYIYQSLKKLEALEPSSMPNLGSLSL